MGNRQVFPQLYDTHQGDYLEDLPFWLELAQNKPHPVLELGCGTGRVTLELVRRGFEVIGIDIDHSMLQFLRDKMNDQKRDDQKPNTLLLLQSDMSAFHLNQKFGTIISPCNTLSTLSVTARQNTFCCAIRHLRNKGVLAASIPNPEKMRKLPSQASPEIEEIFYHPEDQNPVQVSSGWRRSETLLNITWYYDHLKPDGLVDRTSVEVHHSLDGASVYLDQLRDAGFTKVSLYGDYDFSAYNIKSEYLILVAEI